MTINPGYRNYRPTPSFLFHDTNVRKKEFGVFRLWSEIMLGDLTSVSFTNMASAFSFTDASIQVPLGFYLMPMKMAVLSV
jgi:hypothetical protein